MSFGLTEQDIETIKNPELKGWKMTTLGEVAEVTSSKRIFASEYSTSGIPFYRGKEIIEKFNGNEISTDLYISKETFEKIKSKFDTPSVGQILLTSVGTLGIPYVVKKDEEFYFKDGNITWIKKFSGINNLFLYYWLISDSGKEQLTSHTIGSTQQALTIMGLKSLVIFLPPLPEQRAIAAILSSLDNKIELLREQNKTLEAIAQAIFKEWFVKFNFPGATGKMMDSELGKIPEGWRVGKIADFGNIICGKTPSTSDETYFRGDIPFIKIPDMHGQVFINQTQSSLSIKGADTQRNKFISENSICVSCIATVGLISITTKRSQTNQQINSIILKEENNLEFLFLTLKNMKDDLLATGAGGSTTLNINTSIFSNIKILFPKNDILKKFHQLISPNFKKLKFNNIQIQTLSFLRDTLLPKLMKGEIRVK